MKKIILSSILSLILALFLLAPSVFAQTAASGLVKCDEQTPGSCTLCTLFQTIKAVYDFVIRITIILAIGYIMYGGYEMMISGANPKLYDQGKSRIYQAFYGLGIVLAAWSIVDIFIRLLNGSADIYGVPWRTLQCQ